jgi:hypothetical protein
MHLHTGLSVALVPAHWSELSRRMQIQRITGRIGLDGLERRLMAFYGARCHE